MTQNICSTARGYVDQFTNLLARLDKTGIDRLADLIFDAWRDDRQVFVFGNGGSAYNASHHVCDYVKTAAADGARPLRAISLNDNIGISTAVGNDIGYEDVFRFPLSAYAKPADIALAISCSGNSPNVLRACEWAAANGLVVVALTGFAGGRLKELEDLHVNIPSDNYGIVEDLHLSIGHMVSQMLRSRIAAEARVPSS